MFGLARQTADIAARNAAKKYSSHGDVRIPENGTPSEKDGRRKVKLLRSSSNLSDEQCENPFLSDRSIHTAHLSDSSSTGARSASSTGTASEAGLQIYLKDGHVRLGYCYDHNLKFVHPNVFAPYFLVDVEKLGGGGSGVAVFSGTHPELGDIVMKHGGFKDLTELFSLATIAEELRRRGKCTDCPAAALKMQDCLPSFKMIYISPHHILLKKDHDYWHRLRKLIRIGNMLKFNSSDALTNSKNQEVSLDDETLFSTPGMRIRIYERTLSTNNGNLTQDLNVVLDEGAQKRKPSLAFLLSRESIHFLRTCTIELQGASDYEYLKRIYDELLPIMTDNLFKFTLAQQRIGGPNAKTGNQWLYEKKLNGKVLMNLVTQFCETVRYLQQITLPEERDIVDEIRAEVQHLENHESNPRADELSSAADQFCGNAIKKNFHPVKGRLRFFRRVCKDFREYNLILTSEEKIPAKHLGNLMLSGALMSDTFVDTSTEPTLLQPHEHFWRNLLARAVDKRKSMSPNALIRVWNSGLADAGIHNLFVSENELFFFDLGEPTLQSMPGFMTKFLFSFFHTLGMQEDENGAWIRRFVTKGEKLALTEETKDLLDEAYQAFEIALDGVITNLFDGDQALRWLLLQYVTLQLLSDAAFCLQRWEVKGGGRPRHGNHNTGLEKWLWRALWDCFVAFDINTADSWFRFDVEHPHFRDSLESNLRFNRRSGLQPSDVESLQEIRSSLSAASSEGRRHSFTRGDASPRMLPKSSFTEVSLRDLTMSTYQTIRPSDGLGNYGESLTETEEDDDDDDSDDDSAIVAPAKRNTGGR